MSLLPKKPRYSGQSIIGILIAMAIFALLGNAIFTLVTSSYRLIGFTRARITARHLAQDRVEFIRNLPFDNVGTSGGIPSGPLEQQVTINRNGLNFTTKTSIIYVDDDFDLTAPNDLLPTDYKRVRIEVSWDGLAASNRNPVVVFTDIAPEGVETTAGGGTLSILVFDSNGEPVPQADVSIEAPSADPAIDLDLQTQNNGRIILPGAPACVDCYEIVVTKTNFSIDRTYSVAEVANPTKPHSTVIEGDLTEVSFAIDTLGTLTISTYGNRAEGFATLPNTSVNLRGDKIIGTDASNQPVYKYDQIIITDGSGSNSLDLEWDNYTASPENPPTHNFVGTKPLNPISLLPDDNINFDIALTGYSSDTLLTVFSEDGTNPIASVSATLVGTTSPETVFSGQADDPDYGHSFFDNLNYGEIYTLTATASGFLDYVDNFEIDGNLIDYIIMTPE
ncbi:hypothetical protein ACFL2C_01170 [Patescibacteria group bacterium]